MYFTLVIAFIWITSPLVQSAPTTALDAAALLKNGQEAQKLNALFQTIKISDPCNAGPTTACVRNAISNCVNNVWNVTNGACSKSQQCFAIPNVKSDGTTLTCTSEKNALSIIDASGAKGGITGADASGSTTGTDPPASSGSSSSSTDVMEQDCTSTTQPSSTTPAPDLPAMSTGPDTVTVTVTVTPTETTLPITTRTISPQDASSIFSSILAQGQSTPSTVLPASATSIDSTTSTISVPPSTIILLTAAPETSASASPPVSAVATSISVTSDNSGGYGYGGN